MSKPNNFGDLTRFQISTDPVFTRLLAYRNIYRDFSIPLKTKNGTLLDNSRDLQTKTGTIPNKEWDLLSEKITFPL